MYKLYSVIILWSVFIASSHSGTAAAANYGACESQYNSSGLCLPVQDCHYIFDMFTSNIITPENEQLLRRSYCGLDNTHTDLKRRILVCCPTKFCHEASPTNHNVIQPGNVLPDAGICGSTLSSYIYGGRATEIDEFPWMALIRYKSSANQLDFYCGGSLINSRYVLTAAHCLYKTSETTTWTVHSVRLGEWDLNTNPDCVLDGTGERHCAPSYVEVEVEQVIPHPSYLIESRNQFYDIALLRLKESVTYSNFIRPICLMAASNFCNNLITAGTAMEVAGWGATEKRQQTSPIKLKITVNATETSTCYNTYRYKQIMIDGNHHLCAGGVDGVDACRGDSGGPLMLRERIHHREVYFAVGVTSFGPTPCGSMGWPGVYSRVCNYMDWIRDSLQP